jgi:hypothetical protein
MAYIGNIPAESYASFERQVFTIVNSQTAYTLTHAVTNENDIRLVVNNVVQEPGSGKAYTAANTTLTLSAALVNGTDEMYCVYLGRALQTVNPPAASVGNSQTAPTIITGQTAETSIATDDTILIHDTSASALRKMTRANFVSGIGGANTPAFFAFISGSAISFGSGAYATVQFNGERFDTASAYNTSTGKFTVPSGQGGTYFFAANLMIGDNVSRFIVRMQKNGSSIMFNDTDVSNAPDTNFGSTIISCSAGDEIRVQFYHDKGSNADLAYSSTGEANYFYGYKLIT